MKTEGRRIHDLFKEAGYPNLAEMIIWLEYYQRQGCVRIGFTLDPEKVIANGGSILKLRCPSIGREPWSKEMLNEPWALALTPAVRAIYERREEDPGYTLLEWAEELVSIFPGLTEEAKTYLEGFAGEFVHISLLLELGEAQKIYSTEDDDKDGEYPFDPEI